MLGRERTPPPENAVGSSNGTSLRWAGWEHARARQYSYGVTVRSVPQPASKVCRHIGVFTFPAYGHIAPALPMLAELVCRGHRVTCLAVDRFADLVGATGAEVVRYESHFPWFTGQDDVPVTSADGAGEPGVLRTILDFFEEALAPLAAAVARFAGDRPHLFAHDVASSEAARLLARAWDLPVVQLCPTMASNGTFSLADRQNQEATGPPPAPVDPRHPSITAFSERKDRLLAAAGLGGVSIDGFGADHGANIVFLPRAFQVAGDTFDDRYAFVGPCLDDRAGTEQWTPPEGWERILLVSLGSSPLANQREFFQACLRQFTGSSWYLVLTLSHRVRPADLGPLPDNAEAHQWLAHPAVLRHASAFVTHAGMGSIMESLYFEVPMVLVPHNVEQRVNARQADDLQLGRVLRQDAAIGAALREAVDRVASSPGIRAAVGAMRRRVNEAGGASQAADFIESLIWPAGSSGRFSHLVPTTEESAA